jgi:hypothetical protein
VAICESGLHASLDPFDALQYAPGAILCLVECDDVVAQHADKLVCRRRRIIKRRDATEMLLAFARRSALRVTHLWGAPPVVKRFLQTGDDSLLMAAAWAAAYAAYDTHKQQHQNNSKDNPGQTRRRRLSHDDGRDRFWRWGWSWRWLLLYPFSRLHF